MIILCIFQSHGSHKYAAAAALANLHCYDGNMCPTSQTVPNTDRIEKGNGGQRLKATVENYSFEEQLDYWQDANQSRL